MSICETIVPPYPQEKIPASIVRIFPAETYRRRIEKALGLAVERYNITHLVVYGDREHFANLHYFTGYDPRFEESILILSRGREPVILVGNEGWSYAEIIPYLVKRILFQSLSLAGQPREKAHKNLLVDTLKQAGIGKGSIVGLVGIKYYVGEEAEDYLHMVDIPWFMGKAIEDTVGVPPVNVTDIMIHPAYGLRTTLDIDEMAVLELAGTKTSRSVARVMANLKEGINEIEASSYLETDGDPLVSHPVLNFTADAIRQGLVSPGSYRLKYGDPFNIGYGYRSSMVARTAMYARNKDDIPYQWHDIMEKVYIPYFKVIVLWYESLKIGISGKSILEKIWKEVPEYDGLNVGLNPGHLIHNDEWTSSIFTSQTAYPIKNGMAIQCDIIACPANYPGVHIEDGLIMADEETRNLFKGKYPEAWERMAARQKLMRDYLHIGISDEVLPLSDMQACLSPWTVNPCSVLAAR
ncbi:MAG: hypothetical protein LBQ38_07300 [Spirochaetaceae bacterium]|jgi:hypothetical protein|nr:hypothetical protein [Spirochaetaceae bacterium]